MTDINRRLKKIEKALNVGQEEQRLVEIVVFCDCELPPDRIDGNTTVRHVRYDDICKRKDQHAQHSKTDREAGEDDVRGKREKDK